MRPRWELIMAPEEWTALLTECQEESRLSSIKNDGTRNPEPDPGTQKARKRLYDLYFDKLYRYFFRRTKCENRALELSQTTFTNVLGRLAKFKGTQAGFEGYLFKTARGTWMRVSKVRGVWGLVDLFVELCVSRDPEDGRNVPDSSGNSYGLAPGKSPEETLMEQEKVQKVNRALLAVQEPYLEPMILYEYENYSYEELAETLKIPIGTVRSRIARGRMQFTQEYMRLTRIEEYKERALQGEGR